MLIVRGNNLYPSAVENLLRGFDEVVEYNILVIESDSLSELELVVEPTTALNGESLSRRIGEAFRDRFHFTADVRVVAPGSLPRFDMKAQRMVRRSHCERRDEPM
jgi:phenylacetate-CoA ligase